MSGYDRGDKAIETLNEIKQKQRERYKRKTIRDMHIYILVIYSLWGLFCVVLGYCLYHLL